MGNSTLQELLTEVNKVCLAAEQERKARQSRGEYFNVFNVLGLRAEEVRLHSAFIATLLNPEENHGVGDAFLRAFLRKAGLDDNYINADNLNTDNIVERAIGYKNDDETEGGRIDIIIEDGTHAVIVENKIYAGDQNNQLLRYSNFGKKNFPKGFKMIYLTLFGNEASESSTGGEKIDYICMSYRNDITAWLTECARIAFDRPLVRETINQYIQLINQLTGRNMEDKHLEEVVKIAGRDENLDSTIAIIEAQYKIAEELRKEYIIEPLRKFTEENGYKLTTDGDSPVIRISKHDDWEKGCIAITADNQRTGLGSWTKMYIGITYGSKRPVKFSLSCLQGKANEWWPFGWVCLPIDNWESPSSFKAMQSGEIANWLIDMIQKIVNETAERGCSI